jgi:hypothetical protein
MGDETKVSWVSRVLGFDIKRAGDDPEPLDEVDRGIVPPAGLAGLPETPGPLSEQGETFVAAAKSGIPFCEECPLPEAG